MRQSLDFVRSSGAALAARGGGGFDPRLVPEIVAGYFWDPTFATGSGATLRVPEGNGKSTYDMVTPAANTAPTAGTINGQVVAQYANGSPDQLMRTSTTVQRGWTGATYFAAWVQAPAVVGSIMGHWRTANNLNLQLNTSDCRVQGDFGGGATEQRFPVAPFGATPFFIEGIFDPSQAATGRFIFTIDRVAQTPTTANALGAALTDTAEFITCGGAFNDSSTFNYTGDFKTGVVYLANGIPSAANRDLLFAFRALK